LVDLVWSTILYHSADLGQTSGHTTFTNLYRRDQGTHID